MSTTNLKRWTPLILGLFVILSALTFVFLGGNASFHEIRRKDLYSIFGGAYYFIYYTIQTNLFLGICLVIKSIKPNSSRANSFLFASVVLITVTFLIYWTAIAPFNTKEKWADIYYNFDSIITHVINPFIGFGYIVYVRKTIVVNKRIVGVCSLYLSFFLAMNAVLYAVTNGISVYSFINIKHLLFMNLENLQGLCWLLNVLLIAVAPWFVILFSKLWLLSTKIRTGGHSYFQWMENIKN